MTIREAMANAVRDLRRQAVEAMRAGDPVAAEHWREMAANAYDLLGSHDAVAALKLDVRLTPGLVKHRLPYLHTVFGQLDVRRHGWAVQAHRILREAGIDVPEPDSSWMATLADQWAREWGL
ncbi:MAG: hypothetical protein U0821_18710 [Chloroflexota bacterium]